MATLTKIIQLSNPSFTDNSLRTVCFIPNESSSNFTPPKRTLSTFMAPSLSQLTRFDPYKNASKKIDLQIFPNGKNGPKIT